ncbi:MAG: ATP-grasp domain-containing protein [Lachnospiraceae bacterium]
MLEQQCRNIAKAVGIRGCVNMEFIEADREAGAYYFLECNPRFAGGVAFSGAAGYDMADAHIRCFTGRSWMNCLASSILQGGTRSIP